MTDAQLRELLAKPTITPEQLHQSGILPVSRNGIYEAIRRGEIQAIEIGRKKAVVTASLRKMLGIEAA